MNTPKADLLRLVNDRMSAYPQYKNYYDGWLACTARRRVSGKGGTHLMVGDLVLYNPDSVGIAAGNVKDSARGKFFVTVYSPRTNSNVFVPLAATSIPMPTGAALQAIQDTAAAEDKAYADRLDKDIARRNNDTFTTTNRGEAMEKIEAWIRAGETFRVVPLTNIAPDMMAVKLLKGVAIL